MDCRKNKRKKERIKKCTRKGGEMLSVQSANCAANLVLSEHFYLKRPFRGKSVVKKGKVPGMMTLGIN